MIDTILPGFAALDLGARKIFVACSDSPVRSFGTVSAELRALSGWLKERRVKVMAMEATGVYWIAVHDQLQAAGFKVTLFHGAHARNLPGRKSDVSDCQWHAMLHSHGLLRPCFIPKEPIRKLRSFYRLREDHLSMAATHIRHMQGALDLMNVRLHQVLSQVHGVSGLRVVEAIVAGERDPQRLIGLCDERVLKRKKALLLRSLEGDWQPHHLFALRQALEAYRFYQGQIAACDAQIESLLGQLNAGREQKTPPPGRIHQTGTAQCAADCRFAPPPAYAGQRTRCHTAPRDQSLRLDEIARRSGHRSEGFSHRTSFCGLGRTVAATTSKRSPSASIAAA